MSNLDVIMILINHRKWKNGYLNIISQDYLAGKKIKGHFEADPRWLKAIEDRHPGFTVIFNEL